MVQNVLADGHTIEQLIDLSHIELLKLPNEAPEPNHIFGNKLYIRSITLPKGMVAVGRRHKDEHAFIVAKGRVLMASKDGAVELEQGHVSMGGTGSKRLALALEDTVLVNVHYNADGCTDVVVLEARYTDAENMVELLEKLSKDGDAQELLEHMLEGK